MKFLADAGISPKTFAYLNTAGHDAVHVRQIGLQRATDVEIALRARQEGRIILTFDLDLDLDLDLGEILALGFADNTNVLSRVSIRETAMDQ